MVLIFILLFSAEAESSGWSEHKTRDGYTCYYDSVTGEYSWVYPEGWSGVSSDLSKEEIQVREREREEGGGRRKERERRMVYVHVCTYVYVQSIMCIVHEC